VVAMESTNQQEIAGRLEYLRSQIQAECISYGELAELQGLAEYIDSDVELLEWAGVPEFPIHLSMPRGGSACGQPGRTDAEHLATTCEACIAIHEAHESAVES
jgi:hypothetical protein